MSTGSLARMCCCRVIAILAGPTSTVVFGECSRIAVMSMGMWSGWDVEIWRYL